MSSGLKAVPNTGNMLKTVVYEVITRRYIHNGFSSSQHIPSIYLTNRIINDSKKYLFHQLYKKVIMLLPPDPG